ncbi:MAG: hypothetical protein IPP46_20320 [Bacteroidetes bacterium]|jgi:hypothetical protein|nr:hypothetical protein [Bacteroidota bacterium]
MKRYSFIILLLLAASGILKGQNAFLPLSNQVEQYFTKEMNHVGNGLHSSFKPFLRRDAVDAMLFITDTVPASKRQISDYGRQYDSLISIPLNPSKKFNTTLVGRKLFSDHLLEVEDEDYRIYLDPVFDFTGGMDLENDDSYYYNTRGVWVNGSIGKKFGFNATFYENLSSFPAYLDSTVRKTRIVPGQGRVKKFDDTSFDYAFSTGSINFQLNRHFTFEFGQDRHFIGDGYRSLLLSDNAFHYPYFKIITDVWKIRYVNLFMELRDLTRDYLNDQSPFDKKYASMHYLDINIGKRASIGIFETVIWHADSGGARGFDMGYLNPFIFLRPVEFSINSPDNVLMGINAKFMINSRNLLYGQLMLDEFLLENVKSGKGWWANKQGIQAGFKSFDVLGVKNLYLQGEMNYVRPYTYQHRDVLGSYSHHRAPLAHPLGANFWEAVGIVRYNYKRWHLDAKISLAEVGYDTAGRNYGQNVFLSYNDRESEFGNEVGQGLKTTIMWVDLNINFLINPVYRMNLFANIAMRSSKQRDETINALLVQGGIRTSLFNRYYDF